MYDRIWQIFCDRLESEVRALDNRDGGECEHECGKEAVHCDVPDTETSESLRTA